MSEVLQRLKERVKTRISDLNFRTWIAPLSRAEVREDTFVLYVPNKFVADWLSDYYKEVLRDEASSELARPMDIAFSVDQEIVQNIQSVTPPTVLPKPRAIGGLNENLSFDRFVVGSSNQFAHAASKAVADFPGGRYNPLFIYGGVGLGKTHILHAIGLDIRRTYEHLKVMYMSAERFMNEVIAAIRYERMNEFRQKFRETCDVLLIDDVQFIGGKERTQEEFFHTFNALHESQRQIVLTSDKPPKDLMGIEERLRSRFEWGLIADIQPPDLETRVAIVKKKAEISGFACPDDVAMFLASSIKTNVRELEGSMIRVKAMAELAGTPITVDFTRGVIKGTLSRRDAGPSVESIQKIVADYYKVSIPDLKSPRRLKSIAYPRQVAMYLCKKFAKASFPEIGGKFGGKDHTTVMHACKKIERLIKTDVKLQDEIGDLEKQVLD